MNISTASPAGRGDLPLSIVITARNDDHGGNLLRRMQIFINGLLQQARRHHLPAELLLVEWNPPPDRAPLGAALDWPATGPCRVRIIQVPPERHRRFRHAAALPLFQMIAKNVGIRRAAGRFVLATNIDLLFSDALVQFLAGDQLDSGCFYRIDRHDVPAEVPLCASIEEQLAYCQRHVIRVNARQGVFPGERAPRSKIGVIRALLAHYLWLAQAGRSAAGARPPSGQAGPALRQLWRYQRGLIQRSLIRLKDLLDPGFPRLHITASGDFTLMARPDWWAVRGYPELEMFSMHLDALLCYLAHYAGLEERVLPDPMRLYHIEHGSGWTPEIDRDQSLEQRLDTLGVPQISRQQLRAWILEMAERRQPLVFNDENWGLATEDLPEIEIRV